MNSPKISIIVAIYNVALYLSKSLNSIINQTFHDFECILINDGSTDESVKIIEEFIQKDSRFSVIHQQNTGQSIARNRAIKQATAPYIAIIDADDWVEPNFLAELYQKAIETQADITYCGQCMVIAGTDEKQMDIFPIKGNYPDTFLFKDYPNVLVDNISIAWNKLYKKEIFTLKNHYFVAGRKYEDMLHGTLILLDITRIAQVQKPLYNYLINREGATTRLYDYPKFKDVINNLKETEDAINKHEMREILFPILKQYQAQFIYFFLPEYLIRTKNKTDFDQQLNHYITVFGKKQSYLNAIKAQTKHYYFKRYSKKIQLLLRIFYFNKNLFRFIMRFLNSII